MVRPTELNSAKQRFVSQASLCSMSLANLVFGFRQAGCCDIAWSAYRSRCFKVASNLRWPQLAYCDGVDDKHVIIGDTSVWTVFFVDLSLDGDLLGDFSEDIKEDLETFSDKDVEYWKGRAVKYYEDYIEKNKTSSNGAFTSTSDDVFAGMPE